MSRGKVIWRTAAYYENRIALLWFESGYLKKPTPWQIKFKAKEKPSDFDIMTFLRINCGISGEPSTN